MLIGRRRYQDLLRLPHTPHAPRQLYHGPLRRDTHSQRSLFGGVTCLPGCFSMYRLKARKVTDDAWVPICKLEIVREYGQSEIGTLHRKNLLLLGQDRFLTTILLRTFPNRKMMFLPQVRCRIVAHDTFGVLLSQRRRWINSTTHNAQ